MNILDIPERLSEVDPKGTLATLLLFPDQVKQAWDEVNKIEFPKKLRGARNVVLAGMGGSALPGVILKSLESKLLKVPFEIVSRGELPAYVDGETLVILSSYSGETAETLKCAQQAIAKTERIFVFTTGGKLAQFSIQKHLESYRPLPIFNPSALPRFSLGYSLTTFLAVLRRLGYLGLNQRTITSLVRELEAGSKSFGPTSLGVNNQAKQLAETMGNVLPILVGAAHLSGAAVAVQTMLHETAKTLAFEAEIPELNHHLLEAFSFPTFLRRRTKFIFFSSRYYSRDVQRRIKLTKVVLDKQRVGWSEVELLGPTRLHETYKLIQIGGFSAFYLAVSCGIDPGSTPWVDYLKKHLG